MWVKSMSGLPAINFRDLGGLISRDGRRVRPGLVYRSGHLCGLSRDITQALHATEIKAVFDLRHPRERQLFPTDASLQTQLRLYSFSDGPDGMSDNERSTFMENASTSHAAMLDSYRRLPIEHAVAYRAMFEHVRTAELPVLIHCAAGKDRTGVGIALLLLALGVRRQEIMRDYLLSNASAARTWAVVQRGLGREIDEDLEAALQPLVVASPDYLEATFLGIRHHFGSTERYLEDCLRVTRSKRAALKDRLMQEFAARSHPSNGES
jgi:protein-tyrosine phosphatase